MAGIKEALSDILTKLNAINVKNAEGGFGSLYARIWNNQVGYLNDGSGYSWPRPAAFVEVVSPASFEVIGSGFRSADLGIKIHIVHDFYNADDTFEQDMVIFDLRDQVIMGLSQYCPTACGPLNCISEFQDYNHGNIYHYICEFICNLTDSRGSKYEPEAGNFTESANANLDLDVKPEFIIPQ